MVTFESSPGNETMPVVKTWERVEGGTTLVVMRGAEHWILERATTWGDQWLSATGVPLTNVGNSRKPGGVAVEIVPLPSERTHGVAVVGSGGYIEPMIEDGKRHTLPLSGIGARLPLSGIGARPRAGIGRFYPLQSHGIVASRA